MQKWESRTKLDRMCLNPDKSKGWFVRQERKWPITLHFTAGLTGEPIAKHLFIWADYNLIHTNFRWEDRSRGVPLLMAGGGMHAHH